MHAGRRAGDALSLAKEGGLLAVALDEMDHRTWFARERARNHEAGESSAGAEIDPDPRIRREIDELERVGDVARPQTGGSWMAQ